MIAGVDLDTLSSIDILCNQIHIYIIEKYTPAEHKMHWNINSGKQVNKCRAYDMCTCISDKSSN